MTIQHNLLTTAGFSEPMRVEGRESIAHLFPAAKRCGIYVLHFADGVAYVGQSIDVTRRYVEHRRNHHDIQQLSFKLVNSAGLDASEYAVRELLQHNGQRLRGVVGVVRVPGEADFDLIMTDDEQQRWLAQTTWADYRGTRLVSPALRGTYAGRFARLKKKPLYTDALAVLHAYVGAGIPCVRASEDSFWACSCLPKTAVYARININWQETLSIYEQDGELHCSFHLACSPLDPHGYLKEYFSRMDVFPYGIASYDGSWVPAFDARYEEFLDDVDELYDLSIPAALQDELSRIYGTYPGIQLFNHHYKPGGQDQIQIEVIGAEQALQLLRDERVIRAIRQFNLRLMRHGPSPYKSSHCLDLADLLITPGSGT